MSQKDRVWVTCPVLLKNLTIIFLKSDLNNLFNLPNLLNLLNLLLDIDFKNVIVLL